MRLISALLLSLVSSASVAFTPSNCEEKGEIITLSEAESQGIELVVEKDYSEKGCHLINVLSPDSYKEQAFSGASVYLYLNRKYVGGFDLNSGINSLGTFSSPFEICTDAVDNITLSISFGKYCKGTGYAITFDPKSL